MVRWGPFPRFKLLCSGQQGQQRVLDLFQGPLLYLAYPLREMEKWVAISWRVIGSSDVIRRSIMKRSFSFKTATTWATFFAATAGFSWHSAGEPPDSSFRQPGSPAPSVRHHTTIQHPGNKSPAVAVPISPISLSDTLSASCSGMGVIFAIVHPEEGILGFFKV